MRRYRNAFYFDNESSMNYDLYISGHNTFSGPEMNIEKVSIPGRNGDLFISGNSYKNCDYSYSAFIEGVYDGNFEEKVSAVRSWLLSKTGYRRLEDDYHKDEFRLAMFKGAFTIDTLYFKAGATTLTFDCKPQRFLKLGERPLTYTAGTYTLLNPTKFTSNPLIEVTGTAGTLTVNGKRVQLLETGGIIIDSEVEQAYNGTTFKNDKIKLLDNVFPTLVPDRNTIVVPSGMTIKITPRWFIL